MDKDSGGIVYVLSNPSMPGLIKIGKTSRGSVLMRLSELYSTGVPVPFECEFAGRVEDEHKVEKAFHMAFGPYRVNPKREFFQIEPEQAITLLQLMITEDVTPTLQREADSVDPETKSSSNKLKSRRPVLDFLEMGIPVGSTLNFSQSDLTCVVTSNRRVEYQGSDFSLTKLTQTILDLPHQIQPSPHWTYKGRKLKDIYDEVYGSL